MSLFGLGGSSLGTRPNPSQQTKDLPLCPEILATVDQFKAFVSEQKKIREELVNLSQQPLVKLKADLTSMVHQVSSVTSELRCIGAQRDRLKEDVLKEEGFIGIAQRNFESGSNFHLENTATTEYFLNKLLEFDVRMRSYKQELEVLEEHANTRARYQLSPKALVSLLRQMDNEFICLAAQLHSVYEQIKTLKSRYLRNQRITSSDGRNPFSDIEASCLKLRYLDDNSDRALYSLKKTISARTPYGPSPFSTVPSGPAFSLTSLGGQTAQSAIVQPTNLQTTTVSSAPGVFSTGLGTGSTIFRPTSGFGLTSSLTAPTLSSAAPSFQFTAPAAGAQTTKPLFGFGIANTTATNPLGASPLSKQSTGTPSLGFTGFGSAVSTSDNQFGKRLALKPTSLVFPRS
ncbi:unnamed protein product [Dicrocoelium dendriticum]|nr:unnamed protein product [Dicrocoelium dendriticum]